MMKRCGNEKCPYHVPERPEKGDGVYQETVPRYWQKAFGCKVACGGKGCD